MKVGIPRIVKYTLPALPLLEPTPAAVAYRREIEEKSRLLHEIHVDKTAVIARSRDEDLPHDEIATLHATVGALTAKERTLQDEIQLLKAQERDETQPDQPTILAWQQEYDRLLKTNYLPALEHFVAAWGELYAFTLKAVAQRISLRLAHGPHAIANTWAGQLKQFLKEPRP